MFRVMGRANVLALSVLLLGVLLTFVNVFQLRQMQASLLAQMPAAVSEGGTPNLKYVVYGKNIDSGYLKHVYRVLERAGYVRTNYNTSDDWNLMWAHDYPFKKIRPVMMKMKKGQRVNKLPGSGFVTNKVNLAVSGIDERIPKVRVKQNFLYIFNFNKLCICIVFFLLLSRLLKYLTTWRSSRSTPT